MRSRRARGLTPLALVWLLAAGLGAPPAALAGSPEELEATAARIEDMVRGPADPAPPVEAAPRTGTGDAAAAMGVDTPEFRKAIALRRARLRQVQFWKGKLCIGETNQGLLFVRDSTGGCHSGIVKESVTLENADREDIYRAVAEQENLPASEVRAAFAKIHRDRMRAGEWVQRDSGHWVRK